MDPLSSLEQCPFVQTVSRDRNPLLYRQIEFSFDSSQSRDAVAKEVTSHGLPLLIDATGAEGCTIAHTWTEDIEGSLKSSPVSPFSSDSSSESTRIMSSITVDDGVSDPMSEAFVQCQSFLNVIPFDALSAPAKVEETPRPLKDVIVVTYDIIHRKDPAAPQRVKQKEVCDLLKELILLAERVVFATLAFDLNVLHPYKPFVEAIKKFELA
ncbi:hypothetical protein RJ641_001661 [Dillenia turbinata]|uniref:Uncharacterized protein n=1 Tax=Dillenia turbinata TaxID=194707 RepID=A0AAN8VRF1_9MAGN